MRDSFGGVFTINLLLVFIFIYVAFTAVSLTYARAFRLKNKVIDFIEQNEIISLDENYLSSKLYQLDNIITNTKYNVSCEDIGLDDGVKKEYNEVDIGFCYKGIGIKIKEIEELNVEGTETSKIKYEVTTGATWNLGALNKILVLSGEKITEDNKMTPGTWLITGEAVVIKR